MTPRIHKHLARLLVGAVIHAAGDVGVNGGKEERSAVGMQVAQQPAVIDVAHDRFDGDEGEIDMRRVMHRQHDAGDDLHAQHEGQNAAERPPVVQVARGRISDEGRINQAHDRQPPLHPLHEWALRLIGRMSAHDRTLCLIRLIAISVLPVIPSALRTAPLPCPEGFRRRTDRSHPAWGRSEATHTGGVLLAPLPGECKCRLTGLHSPVFPAPNRPDFGHAYRPLPARYPAEHGNRIAAMRMPRDRGPHH